MRVDDQPIEVPDDPPVRLLVGRRVGEQLIGGKDRRGQQAEHHDRQQHAIGRATQQDQEDPEHRVGVQDVTEPEQHPVRDAEGQQCDETAKVDTDRMGRPRHQPFQLDREPHAEQEREQRVELAREEGVHRPPGGAVGAAWPALVRRSRIPERRVEAGHVHHQDAEQRKGAQDIERDDAFAGSDGTGEAGCGLEHGGAAFGARFVSATALLMDR